ncbi:hypothetical protein ACFXPA_46630 [Amycolatopsis sp. NPDC059090]|uniref:hypothetical protein n=1 Tax=unclassified Amycolatopsis TaxID=2618356 RepID=UPI00366F3AEA
MPEVTGGIAAAVVAGSIAVAGVVTGGASAEAAQVANACRSWVTHDYARITDNIRLDSCYYVTGGYVMSAQIPFENYSGAGLTYCAHALDTSNLGGPWPHDFGCTSSGDKDSWVWAGTDRPFGSRYQYWSAPQGTYVVSTGVWLNGRYLGDVQSPRTYIGAH